MNWPTGSENNLLFRLCTGPAGQQLGTGPVSVPRRLGPVNFELGVIAGDRSLNPLFSAWIKGPDDGKVSVAATQIDGMQDFLVLHHSHTWMAWRRDAVKATLTFLESGRFDSRRSPTHGPAPGALRHPVVRLASWT